MRQLAIILAILTGLSTAAAKVRKGENICGTENVTVDKGSSFSVGVYVNNLDTLAGMQIPIYYRSDDIDLRCDSVTFRESRCNDFTMNDFKIEPVGRTVYFVLIGTHGKSLPPGEGKVATLWFTVDSDSRSGQVELFSGPKAYLPDQKINYNYLFWQPSAKQVRCRYQPGYITVK
ncbi:MAG: cohesin domain-containing protein [candidate division Zixibacteria bacterium]